MLVNIHSRNFDHINKTLQISFAGEKLRKKQKKTRNEQMRKEAEKANAH